MAVQRFVENLLFELYQDDSAARLFQILNSKRLMKDHLDILEDISSESEPIKTSNYIKPSVAVGLVATVTASSYWVQQIRSNKIAQTAALIVPGCYLGLLVIKLSKRFLNRHRSKKLDDLINRTQRIDNNLQKHLLFLNELRILHTDEFSWMGRRTQQRQEKIIGFIRTATMRFYKSIQYLEANSVITQSHYDPIESMDVEDAFDNKANNEAKVHLKQIYNLFLYMQSHFLLLLGEAVIKSEHEKSLHSSINQQIADLVRDLNPVDNRLKFETIVRKPVQMNPTKSDAASRILVDLKRNSSNLVVKLSAIAHKFTEIDQQVSRCHEIPENMLPSLQTIENSLALCNEELQRFLIFYQKSLHMELPQIEAVPTQDRDDVSQKEVRTIAHDDILPEEGDYFAVFDGAYDENQPNEEPQSSLYDELNIMDQKLVKRKFKNVLTQLKGKIEPIEKSFVERERNFHTAKGHDPDQLLAKFIEASNSSESEEEDTECDDEIDVKSRKPTQDKFEEMRKLLMSKTQMPLMQLPMMSGVMGEEEILE